MMHSPARYRRRIARRPRTAVVQADSFCNLNCTYCYLPDRDRRAPMSVAIAEAVARSVAEFAWPR
ncbi:hypothetical protein ACIRST_23245 [Kitasatospora sp. NPDC101447]|uniref:hypothetical protein n=1 Tax=Kitasatospora sp. NPDC101447 TaxID=3364102 RepID=UPI0037F80C49